MKEHAALVDATALPFGVGAKHKLEKSTKRQATLLRRLGKLAGAQDVEEVAAVFLPAASRRATGVPAIQDGDPPAGAEGGPAAGAEGCPAADAEGGAAVLVRKPSYKRKKCDGPSLKDLVEVVEHALALPSGTPRQKVLRADPYYGQIMKSNKLSNLA